MGGNALKQYGVKRVDKPTYERIKKEALEKLSIACERCEVPYAIENKEDFGDVDILCIIKPDFQAQWKQWIISTFQPRAVIHNSNVWSFNIEDLQIDTITTSKENWQVYFNFLCWGDLSMTMGRISRLWDMKYGIYGLEFPVRDPVTNHVLNNIPISKDTKKIFEFMGYSFERWQQGFKTSEELREYLFSSPKIHQGFLEAHSEATKHRKRDKNRPTFAAWFKYFEEHRHEYPKEEELDIPKTTEERIGYIEKHFPESNLRARFDTIWADIRTTSTAREKFSGRHLQEMFPELTPKDFGAYMSLWTAQWKTKDEQINYILNSTIEELTKRAKLVRARLTLDTDREKQDQAKTL